MVVRLHREALVRGNLFIAGKPPWRCIENLVKVRKKEMESKATVKEKLN